jgi:N-methylhydantoinase A
VPEHIIAERSEGARPPPRRAYFGDKLGFIETPVLRRSELTSRRAGPVIIEEYDATCLVPPGAQCERDASGNILIEIGSSP